MLISLNRCDLLMVASLSLMITACSKSDTSQNNQVDTSKQVGVATSKPSYTVATVKQFKPFVFRGDDQQLKGFDIDVVNAIANAENFEVSFIPVEREQRYNAIINKQYDMLAAGVTITDERKEQMKFSDPYFMSKQAVIAQESAPEIKNFNQLKQHTVAVSPNTTSAKVLDGIIQNKDNIIPVKTPFNGVEAVIQKKSDYAMSDYPVLTYYTNTDSMKPLNLKVYTDESYPLEPYGFVFAKDRDDGFVEKVNDGLAKIKADGTFQKIEEKWFGNTSSKSN